MCLCKYLYRCYTIERVKVGLLQVFGQDPLMHLLLSHIQNTFMSGMDPFIVHVRPRDSLVLYQSLWLWDAIRVCLAHKMSSSVSAAFQGEWGVISYQPGSLQDKGKHPFSLQSKQSGCRYLLVVCTEFPWTLHTTQILIPLTDLSPFRLFLVE